ncbi:MAG: amino acid-binding domain protein [Solirubrobacterales bacterium]|nr:amino acid-binding domain protein [Solirubrobacterales bacterium]
MSAFAVSAIGRDRPGIIAAVTEVLVHFAVNIDDAQGGLLRGHFSLTLICSGGDHLEEADLERALQGVRERLDLEAVTVRRVETLAPAEPPRPTHRVRVTTQDRPGIVHAVCSALAAAEVSVIQLVTRTKGPGAEATMELGIEAPDDEAATDAGERLARIASAAEVEILFAPVRARDRAVGAAMPKG